MSSVNLQQQIATLRQRGRELLDHLLQIQPLLRGSFTQVYTRCGKSNCWCAHSPKGHPHVRLTWSENGHVTTRKVPAPAADQVRKLTGNYRQFRALRRQLQALQARLQDLLDRYEQSLIVQAQRPLRAVGFSPKMSARTGKRRQNRPSAGTRHK
jgi:hypothetical protein